MWLVANMDDYLGAFPTRRAAVDHFAGSRTKRRGRIYEIVGSMDDPRQLTGRYIFKPEDATPEGLDWAVEQAREKGDL